ncbi:MAG: S-adenosylmethionine synthase, partial [Proteobacteria bacterium]|nr:S-adenosylmethionine synthase [Pseudomonadota bacterium]
TCDITVACAFVSKHILNIDDYAHKKQRLAEQVLARSQAVFAKSTLLINNADDIKQELIYMTVSGTSAEAGDDGETGRGNRTNGLITPYRPMSIEAAAGKNSYSHTGKLYQIAASHIARSMVKELSGVSDCECFLLSCIGKPVTEPKIVHLRFCAAEGENWDITHPQWLLAHEIIDDQLRKIPELWTEIISDRITIY